MVSDLTGQRRLSLFRLRNKDVGYKTLSDFQDDWAFEGKQHPFVSVGALLVNSQLSFKNLNFSQGLCMVPTTTKPKHGSE